MYVACSYVAAFYQPSSPRRFDFRVCNMHYRTRQCVTILTIEYSDFLTFDELPSLLASAIINMYINVVSILEPMRPLDSKSRHASTHVLEMRMRWQWQRYSCPEVAEG